MLPPPISPPVLQIAALPGGDMAIIVVGSVPPVIYQFIGNALEAQMASIRLLANRMSNGVQAVRDAVGVIFEAGAIPDDAVFSSLFDASRGMTYVVGDVQVIVPYSVDVSFLIEQTMIDAGDALMALL